MLDHRTFDPDINVDAIRRAYEEQVRRRCPAHLEFAMAVLARLPPSRWRLEWKLPWWLGLASGLDLAVAYEVVLSNVLGLASIRLQDDLADGDVPPDERTAAVAVSAALYDAALDPYRRRLPAGSPFWRYLDEVMADWREASAGRSHGSRSLAAIGAPLKLGAAATCLLADRADLVEPVSDLLDDAIHALVLYDHLADWEVDVAAGRWNAFVASIPTALAAEGDPARARAAVLVALLTTDALRDAVNEIDIAFRRASAGADALEPSLTRLSEALDELAADARSYGSKAIAHYGSLSEEVAKLLIPAAADGRS